VVCQQSQIKILNNQIVQTQEDRDLNKKLLDEAVETIMFKNGLIADLQKETYDINLARYNIPDGHNKFKTFMDYRTITDTTSRQYAFQEVCITDEKGYRRCGKYYVVAMGTYYGDIGDRFYIQTTTNSFYVIIGEIKSDEHTVNGMYTAGSDCMLEFIVDAGKLDPAVVKLGNVSFDGFGDEIISVIKIEN
jgi:hypothetical protein